MSTAILPAPAQDRNPAGRETPHTPDRSLEQRMDALATANRVRIRRAQLKRDIAARRVEARALILDPPWYADTMKVWDLLLAVPKLGRTKVNRTLVRCRVSPSKTVGGLSDRQRMEIVGCF